MDGKTGRTYVECCDRCPPTERTRRVWIKGGGAWVRVCRDGMGCASPVYGVSA